MSLWWGVWGRPHRDGEGMEIGKFRGGTVILKVREGIVI